MTLFFTTATTMMRAATDNAIANATAKWYPNRKSPGGMRSRGIPDVPEPYVASDANNAVPTVPPT